MSTSTARGLRDTTSRELFEQATGLLPGGVNSPVRAFGSVGGTPRFIERARGARIVDADGNEYVDYVGSWGPMLLGHGHPAVLEALRAQLERGTSFGAPTRLEVEVAETLVRLVPSLEMVRMVNSGTEATMAAVRLARAATGRAGLVKFAGCYHGHADAFLIKAGSGAATFGTPDSPGVTPGTARDTFAARFNDADDVARIMSAHAGEVAAVIVEPVVGNMGVVPPRAGFLEALRNLCDEHGALLIFDEVMTGFRVSLQGAQGLYEVVPDLTVMGKVLGGGLPLAAYGGRADLMDQLSPDGAIYQAGTLSGNPLAVAAGLATLKEIEKPGFYEDLENRSRVWESGLREAMNSSPVPWQLNRVGSMLTVFFAPDPVRGYASTVASDAGAYGRFFQACLREGLYLAPSQFEAGFLSAAHDESLLARVAESVRRAVQTLI
jgi:glutamate-1-semialdehyde 2,1-aminomutase